MDFNEIEEKIRRRNEMSLEEIIKENRELLKQERLQRKEGFKKIAIKYGIDEEVVEEIFKKYETK